MFIGNQKKNEVTQRQNLEKLIEVTKKFLHMVETLDGVELQQLDQALQTTNTRKPFANDLATGRHAKQHLKKWLSDILTDALSPLLIKQAELSKSA